MLKHDGMDLLDAATNDAVSAAHSTAKSQEDSSSNFYRAIVSVTFMMTVEQSRNMHVDRAIIARKSRFRFREFLKRYAYSGGVVWRDTEDQIAKITAMPPGKERETAASRYVDHRPRRLRLKDWIARLQTLSTCAALDISENHKDVIELVYRMSRSRIDTKEGIESFNNFFCKSYGNSGVKVYNKFFKPKKKKERTLFEQMSALLFKLSDEELKCLIALSHEESARRIRNPKAASIAA